MIQLKDNQVAHVEQLEKILFTNKEPIALDISVQGSGKTFVATHLANRHFKHVVVIAPKSTLPKWQMMRETHNLPAKEGNIITYASLRGSKNKSLNHKLLVRNDYTVLQTNTYGESRSIAKVEYKVTKAYEKMLDEGLLLIIDEFQNIKNATAQHLACKQLIAPISRTVYNKICRPNAEQDEIVDLDIDTDDEKNMENEENTEKKVQSRVMLLSGSPIDKDSQIPTLLKTMGVMAHDQLANYNPWTKSLVWANAGLQEIINYCTSLDKTKTEELTNVLVKPVKAKQMNNHLASNGVLTDSFQKLSLENLTNYIDTQNRNIADKWDSFKRSEPNKALDHHVINTEHDLVPIVYNLFMQVIKPAIASYCHIVEKKKTDEKVSLSEEINITLHRKNGFYKIIDPNCRKALSEAVGALESAVSFDRKTGTIQFPSGVGTAGAGGAVFGQMTKCLMAIEKAKLSTFIRVIRERLTRFRNEKVVVCVNYKETLYALYEVFRAERYEPLLMDGSTDVKKRGEIIARFLANDTTDLAKDRLLLGNLAVLSTGIDLDDTSGNRPRFCIVSPNYSCINLYQLSYRFLRQNTKSDSNIHILYGNEKDCQELKIINALSKKGTVMRDMTGNQHITMKYPCDYDDWKEDLSNDK